MLACTSFLNALVLFLADLHEGIGFINLVGSDGLRCVYHHLPGAIQGDRKP